MKKPWRVERQFGRAVGTVCLLIGAWLTWRASSSIIGSILLAVGSALVVLGVVYPRALVHPNHYWMKMAEGLSFVSTRVILGFVFFGVVTPLGVIMRLTGWDPLGRRGGSRPSYWVPYPERQRDPTHFEKMF